MRRLKDLFDPDGVLNPGAMLSAGPITRHMVAPAERGDPGLVPGSRAILRLLLLGALAVCLGHVAARTGGLCFAGLACGRFCPVLPHSAQQPVIPNKAPIIIRISNQRVMASLLLVGSFATDTVYSARR